MAPRMPKRGAFLFWKKMYLIICYEFITIVDMFFKEVLDMKKNLITLLLATTFVLAGCSTGETTTPGSDPEPIESDQKSDVQVLDESVAGDTETSDADNSLLADTDSEDEEATFDTTDYTEQIQSEIADIASSSESLNDEFLSVSELFDKYQEMRQNAGDGTQAAMNEMVQWETCVWKTEAESLLSRIEATGSDDYDGAKSVYDEWESNVDAMAKKLSEGYKDGSIYGMICEEEKAFRYQKMSYGMAEQLAAITDEADFTMPMIYAEGIYGDYTFTSDYMVITDGMETGSYEVSFSIEGVGEFSGYGYVSDYESTIDFELEDGTKGTIEYSYYGAELTITESTDNGLEDSYSFYSAY